MNKEEFDRQIDLYFQTRRDEMLRLYHRVLPSGELIFNRFDKAKYLRCGEETSIYDTCVIMGDVEIGAHVWVGPYTLLEGANAKLKIGNYVSINTGVSIYTHDSTKYHVSGGIDSFEKGDVSIGDCTVIGTMSMITAGVTIGSHSVVCAHSFVNRDVPDYTIVGGVPAKPIGKVQIDNDGKVIFKYD